MKGVRVVYGVQKERLKSGGRRGIDIGSGSLYSVRILYWMTHSLLMAFREGISGCTRCVRMAQVPLMAALRFIMKRILIGYGMHF